MNLRLLSVSHLSANEVRGEDLGIAASQEDRIHVLDPYKIECLQEYRPEPLYVQLAVFLAAYYYHVAFLDG